MTKDQVIGCVCVHLLRVSLLPHVRWELSLVLQKLWLLLLRLLLLLEEELASLNKHRQNETEKETKED